MIRLVARPTFGYRFLDSPAHAEAGGQADDLGNVVQLSFVCMVCSRNQKEIEKKSYRDGHMILKAHFSILLLNSIEEVKQG